ncbi:glycosyltransferase [Streptosporangium sp. NPDC000396]|uniref:glycosyltransferase n=1 Tax=Streptosporangium sp. NPDC000396 TaxID=3366185 RepID=UPI0036AE444F
MIIAEFPRWRSAPMLPVDGAKFWRTLLDVRIRREERKTSRHSPASGRFWRVEASFGKPAPAGDVLRALSRGLAGRSRETLHTPVVSLSGAGSCQWRPGDPNVTVAPLAGPAPARVDATGGDLSLRAAGATAPRWQASGMPLIDRAEPGGRATGSDRLPGRGRPDPHLSPDDLPPIDERSVCPVGFVPAPDGSMGELVDRSGAYEVVQGDDVIARVPLSGSVTEVDVARLRRLTGVAVDLRGDWTAPMGVARAICGLAVAGVPVAAEPGPAWSGLLGAEPAALLTACGAADLSDGLVREQLSIRLRRSALALHGVAGRWRRLAIANGLRPPDAPTISVLLCTRRPDMVRFALDQVSRQRGAEAELILTLHGFSAAQPDVSDAIAAYKGEITVVEADSRTVFGDALNRAARLASGTYLAKMDDDDWYGPDHLSDLLLAHHYSSADVVGSAPEFVYLERIGVTVLRNLVTEAYTHTVAGGTMLMTRGLFDDVGGFRPIPRTVDGQLLEAVSAAGGRIYRTHGFNYILRRREAVGHTWQEPINTFLRAFQRQWRGLYANPLMEMEELSSHGERGEAQVKDGDDESVGRAR